MAVLPVLMAYRARELRKPFTNICGQWRPRDLNELADKLSKDALTRAGVRLRLQPAF